MKKHVKIPAPSSRGIEPTPPPRGLDALGGIWIWYAESHTPNIARLQIASQRRRRSRRTLVEVRTWWLRQKLQIGRAIIDHIRAFSWRQFVRPRPSFSRACLCF